MILNGRMKSDHCFLRYRVDHSFLINGCASIDTWGNWVPATAAAPDHRAAEACGRAFEEIKQLFIPARGPVSEAGLAADQGRAVDV